MNEIIYQKSYKEYKAELEGVLQRTAEGFVQIGYLLKVARDTNILEESGYKSVAEFAEAEYNLNKTQVSRFISINDKFSEGGYSDHLMSSYQGYGYAKLTIMLQLPDAINEELTTNYSKAEIQAIKDEVDEEHKVSDIERYMEGQEPSQDNMDERTELLYRTIGNLGEDDPELYVTIANRQNEDLAVVLPEIMAPAGDKMYSVRVRGVGRMMISISDMSEYVKLINIRNAEKEQYSWEEVAAAWKYAGILEDVNGITCWEKKYERRYPVAPVQQKPETALDVKKPEQKKKLQKETKVVRATAEKEWKSIYHVGQQIKVIANDHIGELAGKTEKTGKWNIQFPTYKADMMEAQFTEYTEEEENQENTSDRRELEHENPEEIKALIVELFRNEKELLNDIYEYSDYEHIAERMSHGGENIFEHKDYELHMNQYRVRLITQNAELATYSWAEFVKLIVEVFGETYTEPGKIWSNFYGEGNEPQVLGKSTDSDNQQLPELKDAEIDESSSKIKENSEFDVEKSGQEEGIQGQAEITEYFDKNGDYKIPENIGMNPPEDAREVEENTREESAREESARAAGYKSAVTNNLNTLIMLWEGSNPIKLELMLDKVESLKWRLEKLKEIEDMEREED